MLVSVYLSSQHTILGPQNHDTYNVRRSFRGKSIVFCILHNCYTFLLITLDCTILIQIALGASSKPHVRNFTFGVLQMRRQKYRESKDARPVSDRPTAESQASWFLVQGFLLCLFYFTHVQLMLPYCTLFFLVVRYWKAFQEHNH